MRHHNGDPDLLTIRDGTRHVRVDDRIVRRWIKQGVGERDHISSSWDMSSLSSSSRSMGGTALCWLRAQ